MTKRIILTIQGMECPNCAIKLEGIEDRVAGVLMAEASYQKGWMKVEYNETQISETQIQAEVQRLGYAVTGIKPTQK